jgi:hypothetical protein
MESLIDIYEHARPKRRFDDDQLLGVYAIRMYKPPAEILDLTRQIHENALHWSIPEGKWKVYILHLSRNFGLHPTYINMMDRESCRILIDAVYEPHYQHYKDDFGKTIAGFFSDEPELGNWKAIEGNVLGTQQDLPWSRELPIKLQESLGNDYRRFLPLLWENEADAPTTAYVRYVYMDAVTRLVEEDFSKQIGEWCHGHGVEYTGHVVEDNNQHARTGSSLGHYFRGLAGQHIAGVDVVNRQILPQGADVQVQRKFFLKSLEKLLQYDGVFFHYVLAKLASSHAAIDPVKKGRAMCEIFGGYGWGEGVRLEKFLVDHFLVRGVNLFVPHAFNPAQFPDKDAPPHFYADGHDPQYRHFGYLMAYTNRICELISDGCHVASAAILYHGEAEWTGKCMLMQKPARILADHQIDFDIIPQDVFSERDRYRTTLGEKLRVNTQEYKTLIVPTAQFVTEEFAIAAKELQTAGFPILFLDQLPEGICNCKDTAHTQELLERIRLCPVIPLGRLIETLVELRIPEVSLSPDSAWIRYLHYRYEDGTSLYFFVNEGTASYRGTITLPDTRHCYAYNAWDNRMESVVAREIDYSGIRCMSLDAEIQPLKSLLIVFENKTVGGIETSPVKCEGERIRLKDGWTRSTCAGIEYPNFKRPKIIKLPDRLVDEEPRFSGFVRYEKNIQLPTRSRVILEIEDAYEGVEVFINEKSAGVQIAPPFQFDISDLVGDGENKIRIEVATTLERQVGRKGIATKVLFPKPTAPLGISGNVNVYIR